MQMALFMTTVVRRPFPSFHPTSTTLGHHIVSRGSPAAVCPARAIGETLSTESILERVRIFASTTHSQVTAYL